LAISQRQREGGAGTQLRLAGLQLEQLGSAHGEGRVGQSAGGGWKREKRGSRPKEREEDFLFFLFYFFKDIFKLNFESF
jgi:hypothetical protein